MAPEIADSDAESDIIGNDVADPLLLTIENATPAEQVSPPQIDFDQFLEPTQQLSSLSTASNGVLGPSTGSTEKMLRGLANAQLGLLRSSWEHEMDKSEDNNAVATVTKVSKGKRSLSAVNEGCTSMGEPGGKKKRVKTYGSKPGSGSTVDLFADMSTDTEWQLLSVPNSSKGTQPNPAIIPEEEQYAEEIASAARERDRPRRVISLLGQSIITPGHQLSTAMSSMGGYQSINLDFRGAPNGLDINANLFGGLSQVSVDREIGGSLQMGEGEKEMMTTPERSQEPMFKSINPAVLTQRTTLNDTPNGRSSERCKTDNIARGTTASPAPSSRRAASVSAESVMSDISQSKKPGRKTKASKLKAAPPAPNVMSSQQEAMAPPELPEAPPPRRSRRGTLDSSSQFSHTEETPSNTKRKLKQSKSTPQPEESSPAKQLSSEFNLSDEQLIGLPKENYKPRPSRRRSKPMLEDEDPPQQDWPAPLPEVPEDPPEPAAEPEPSPPKPIKSKVKKSKVKRAKTSAAALLKKSSQMLSDGEDDVIWVDQKPAAVKLDLPPDLKAPKKEDEQKPEVSDTAKTPSGRKSKIIVEIPLCAPQEADPIKATSKKRGRPKKSAPPSPPPLEEPPKAPTPEPISEAEEDEDLIKTSARPALATKDPNTTPNPNATPAKLPATTTTTDEVDKENVPPLHPTPLSKPSPTKGPTTHSPINPHSAWNSKSRYRVGLSKRQSIPSLLRKVDKTKTAPTKVGVKVKELKVKNTGNDDEDGEDGGGGGGGGGGLGLRDKNGELIEWEF